MFGVIVSQALLHPNNALISPEIDNDRRSIKIRGGIRGSLKAGRWCRMAPMGYLNRRDDNSKPIIIPGPKAKFIQYAFKGIVKGKLVILLKMFVLVVD